MKPRLRRLLERAQSLKGDWDDQADAWWRVAELATDLGELALGREAALRVVDAFRRADQPVRVLDAVGLASTLSLSDGAQGLLGTYRLAALVDSGALIQAEEEADALLDTVTDPKVRPMALDTVCGLYCATGRVQALRELIEEMAEFKGPMALGAQFRRAQADALDGDSDGAVAGFEACIKGLQSVSGSHGAIAAAHGELGSLLRLLGQTEDALVQFEQAAGLWDQASRRSGRFLAEADRARAVLDTGGDYMPTALDVPIAFCDERGLALVEAQLRLARGLCRYKVGLDGAREDLSQAIAMPLDLGARLQAGRARLAAAPFSGQEQAELARAYRELQVDVLARQKIEAILEQSTKSS
jgi:tetratricopeptide (TPR) repeat protein